MCSFWRANLVNRQRWGESSSATKRGGGGVNVWRMG